MKANEYHKLDADNQAKLAASFRFKPYVMTVGIGMKDDKGVMKLTRCVWDVQKVPGSSPTFRASLGLRPGQRQSPLLVVGYVCNARWLCMFPSARFRSA